MGRGHGSLTGAASVSAAEFGFAGAARRRDPSGAGEASAAAPGQPPDAVSGAGADAERLAALAERIDELTEERQRELDYAFHDFVPGGRLGYKAREAWEEVHAQCPTATRVATAAAWNEAGYSVPSHIRPITVTDRDGETSLLYDVDDVVARKPPRKTRSDDPSRVLIGQLADLGAAYGLDVCRGGLRADKDDAVALAKRNHVHGALAAAPDTPAVLARAAYTDAAGRRREHVFVATHKGLRPEVEAQALAKCVMRHVIGEQQRERRDTDDALGDALSLSRSADGRVHNGERGRSTAAMTEYEQAVAARRAQAELRLDTAHSKRFAYQWSKGELARETIAAVVADGICRGAGVDCDESPLAQIEALRGGETAREVLTVCMPELVATLDGTRRKLNGEGLYVDPPGRDA